MNSKRKNKISECCDILDNLRVPINDEIRQTMQGNIPYYGANGIQGYIDKYIFDEDLILLAEDGGNFEEYHTRPIAYKIRGKSWVNNHAHILRAKPEFNQDFIFYSLVHKDITKYLNSGTRSKLNKSELEKIEIDFPATKDEEDKIAKILSTADAVIEKTQAAIAKYKAIKQGMLQDLFTRGIDLNTNKLRPRFEDAPELYKESKLGMIPREWDEMSLEESTDYVDYRGKTPPKSDFGVFLVTAKNIRFGYIDYEISKEYIREDSFESAMSRGKVKLGDVLFTTEAPLGNVAQINKEDVALAQRVIKYRGFDNLLDNDYLALCLMSDGFQRQLFSEATGTTVLGIKGSRLHKLKIAIPRLDEQRFIVKRLKAIDNKLQAELTYLQKMQSLKKGLMEDLLSGRKQVKINEATTV